MADDKRSGPAPVRRLLDSQRGDLAGLRRQTRELDRAMEALTAVLPDRLQGHWRVAALSADALMLAVDSPVWATALRGHQEALLEAAGALRGRRPKRIQIRILTPRSPDRPTSRQQVLSESAVENLEETARACDDPRLAEALRRLATRRRQ